MFDITKIQDNLVGQVGIRPPLNPAYDIFNAALKSSVSGLFLDDIEHFKIEYWKDNQDYKDADNTQLNLKMDEIQRSAISAVMHSVFTVPSYTDRNTLLKNAFSRDDTETQINDVNQFYGYEIDISSEKNVALKISRILVEMEGEGDIELQLRHSSLSTPIFTKSITKTGIDDDVITVDLDWTVNAVDMPYKGKFFIGYFKLASMNTLKPFKRDYQWAARLSHFTYLDIRRITTNPDFKDLNEIDFVVEHNGINLDITVYDDYTDLVLNNKFLFSRAIQLQWAITIMKGYLSTLRSNKNERISRDYFNMVFIGIEGQTGADRQRVVGLREQFTGQIKEIKESIDQVKSGYFGDENEIFVTTTT